MSASRKLVLGLRGVGMMVGGPLVLGAAAIWSIVSALRSVASRRMPSLTAAVGALTVAMYAGPVRRWMRTWGGEPGDPPPEGVAVHSVRIDAPAEEVWPWLAQLGQDRGGFYSYEWLENLAGCEMVNANRIHPEWQHREIGEEVMLHPLNGLEVDVFDPPRTLGLKGWGTFSVEPEGERACRLFARGAPSPNPVAAAYYLGFLELPHFLMERRMLLGIKERAEGASRAAR